MRGGVTRVVRDRQNRSRGTGATGRRPRGAGDRGTVPRFSWDGERCRAVLTGRCLARFPIRQLRVGPHLSNAPSSPFVVALYLPWALRRWRQQRVCVRPVCSIKQRVASSSSMHAEDEKTRTTRTLRSAAGLEATGFTQEAK